nr:hypothetical protein [Vicinamibacterales bacterium]
MRATLASMALALASLAVLPPQAAAQVLPRVVEPPATTEFLSRFDYHLAIETLSGDDPQFQWDADFAAEFDIVGSPRARVTSLFHYEAILGEELQPFDPNQGNYAIEVLGARRWGGVEAAVVFHHTSRHLGDRAKDFGIAWNLLGAQVTWTSRGPQRTWLLQGRATTIVMADAVDYTGEFSAHGMYARDLHRRLAFVGRASGVARTVDASQWGRGTQAGGRLEAALRIHGGAADLEVHAGVERRIEAPIFLP